MKQILFLLLLSFPLALLAQQGPIDVSPGYGGSAYYSSSFAQRFEELHGLDVRLLQPEYYHTRKIKKIELSYTDHNLLWMATFDTNGKVLQTGRKGHSYFIVDQQHTDTARHTDTLVRSYYLAAKLMRRDTTINKEYKYRHADTVIAFTRSYSSVYYSGALINEQNESYNTRFLHQKIAVDRNHLLATYNTRRGNTKTNDTHVYLHHRLSTDYDSTVLYHCKKETRDAAFYAVADSGKKMIAAAQLKHHPFGRLLGSKDRKDCYTDGACFDEPVFYYETYTCGTGAMQAQEARNRTHYGFTSTADGLYDTFYSEYDENPRWQPRNADEPEPKRTPYRTTILQFRYEYFE